MKIIIKETNEQKELSIYCGGSQNYAADLIGNEGALDGLQFKFDIDSGTYTCDLETFLWWSNVLNDLQKLNDKILELKGSHDNYEIDNIVSAIDCDIADRAKLTNSALLEALRII